MQADLFRRGHEKNPPAAPLANGLSPHYTRPRHPRHARRCPGRGVGPQHCPTLAAPPRMERHAGLATVPAGRPWGGPPTGGRTPAVGPCRCTTSAPVRGNALLGRDWPVVAPPLPGTTSTHAEMGKPMGGDGHCRPTGTHARWSLRCRTHGDRNGHLWPTKMCYQLRHPRLCRGMAKGGRPAGRSSTPLPAPPRRRGMRPPWRGMGKLSPAGQQAGTVAIRNTDSRDDNQEMWKQPKPVRRSASAFGSAALPAFAGQEWPIPPLDLVRNSQFLK